MSAAIPGGIYPHPPTPLPKGEGRIDPHQSLRSWWGLHEIVVFMLDNDPFLTHKHAGLTLEGYWRAAVQSYWRIAELKLGFDLGAQPWEFMGTSNWFLSHTHLDHIVALPVYV